jgi:YggT family protein
MHVINAFLASVLELLFDLLSLYIWILIVGAVLSWLINFDVVNRNNRIVRLISDFTYRVTEPALRPIRKIIPPINGVDLSPLALIFAIYFVQLFIRHLVLG